MRPQQGFQESYLSSPADIVIGGSGAGVGKTFALLLEPTRHIKNKNFQSIILRRTTPQIRNAGGLWDASMNIYPYLNAIPKESSLKWDFESGASLKFNHLEYEKNVFDHQGAEYCFIGFDELTHFSESQFWYMMSRNRSTCGVKPYVRATCNPDPDSFVAKLIEWWINQETGFPIPERAGALRYFIRENGNIIWGDSKQEVIDKVPHIVELFKDVNPLDLIKSLTFIPGSIYDNQELLSKNPEYLSNLLSQDETNRQRLLDGNWKIRSDKSSLFDFEAISDIFSNYIASDEKLFITCDAARYGRDLCTIFVWKGWEVIHTSILKLSDVHDIMKEIEWCREKFGIQKSKTLVDGDGVGAATVKQGGYVGFYGGKLPKKIEGVKESYKNFKTQCYYYLAENHVNIGDIKIHVNNGNCKVDGVFSTKIKLGAKIYDVQELIRDDLRAIRKEDVDIENKIQINTKESQKAILGRSPDFGDNLMMRCYFEIYPNIVVY